MTLFQIKVDIKKKVNRYMIGSLTEYIKDVYEGYCTRSFGQWPGKNKNVIILKLGNNPFVLAQKMRKTAFLLLFYPEKQ